MPNPQGAIRAPVYGPFEIIGELKFEGREVLSLPFSDVAGCRIMVAVADNYAIFLPTQNVPSHLFPGAEITIWGSVQGLPSLLRRAAVHMVSGPISHVFDYAEGWDTISIRGRNMCGGSTVNGSGFDPQPTQANKFSLKVSVYLMPRSGFAKPSDAGGNAFGRAG